MRISARLDESRSRKLEALITGTGAGTSEVVKRAIDVYYEQYRAERPGEAIRRSDFVGCAEGDPDLS